MESTKLQRSKRDSDAVWYKHEPVELGSLTTSNREQQEALLHAQEKPHGRHFDLGFTDVRKVFDNHCKDPKPFYAFSAHDHRRTLQANGVYGADEGLGRRVSRENEKRLHYTKTDFLSHESTQPYIEQYETSTSDAHQGYKRLPGPSYHRFPKLYKEPPTGLIEPDNNVTKWCGNDSDFSPPFMRTSQFVMLQRKFYPARAPHKQWRYAYNSALKH